MKVDSLLEFEAVSKRLNRRIAKLICLSGLYKEKQRRPYAEAEKFIIKAVPVRIQRKVITSRDHAEGNRQISLRK